MKINRDFPFCDDHTGDIDHLFWHCPFVREIWVTLAGLSYSNQWRLIISDWTESYGSMEMFIKLCYISQMAM